MEYKNPILRGMYPDPSVCYANGMYYMVNSTFEYFPGVPVFSSKDLVNWKQIGNCLTRESQFNLKDAPCSGGIFAPVIRWNKGKFYMITTCCENSTKLANFYVTAEDPSGEWSEPVYIDFEGIDPSIYWEDDRMYIQYGGREGIFQIEIEEETGVILQGPEFLTNGCGGRDAEGPHLWKKDEYYYLLLAEGGTREGHMETLMRSENLWGPFQASPYNPVISNRDFGREAIQCVGHADWIIGPDGKDYLVTLGTRPVKHKTIMGRETMLTPGYWTEDGWLRSKYGYMPLKWDGDLSDLQMIDEKFSLDMSLAKMPLRIVSVRTSNEDCYQFCNNHLTIHGNGSALCDGNSSFWGIRQSELRFAMDVDLKVDPKNELDELGLVMLVTNDCHMSLFVSIRNGKKSIILRKRALDLCMEEIKPVESERENQMFHFQIKGNESKYSFFCNGQKIGWTNINHLSIENAGSPNTGVVGGFYAAGNAVGTIHSFEYHSTSLN